MASTGDMWVQWFSCCFHQPQSPRRRQRHQRMRIDRSMIGNPTNFVHTGMYPPVINKLFLVEIWKSNSHLNHCFLAGHIGSNDTELTPHHMNAIQSQMQGKGGYEANSLRIQVYSHIHSKKYKVFFLMFFIGLLTGMLNWWQISQFFSNIQQYEKSILLFHNLIMFLTIDLIWLLLIIIIIRIFCYFDGDGKKRLTWDWKAKSKISVRC